MKCLSRKIHVPQSLCWTPNQVLTYIWPKARSLKQPVNEGKLLFLNVPSIPPINMTGVLEFSRGPNSMKDDDASEEALTTPSK